MTTLVIEFLHELLSEFRCSRVRAYGAMLKQFNGSPQRIRSCHIGPFLLHSLIHRHKALLFHRLERRERERVRWMCPEQRLCRIGIEHALGTIDHQARLECTRDPDAGTEVQEVEVRHWRTCFSYGFASVGLRGLTLAFTRAHLRASGATHC